MNEQDKQLLLQDICARLPYGINVLVSGEKYFGEEKESYIEELVPGSYLFDSDVILKPYLRPMSSMTEEEEDILYGKVLLEPAYCDDDDACFNDDEIVSYVDYCYSRHLDIHDLIPKGLALEAPEDMYNFNK